MSPRKQNFIYRLIGFRPDQVPFLDAEAKRRGVPSSQVVRDAVDNYRSFLSNGSTDAQIRPIEGK